MDNKPRFKHDCDKCVFICHASVADKTSDLYVCMKQSYMTTIVRFSDEPSDYISFPNMNVKSVKAKENS